MSLAQPSRLRSAPAPLRIIDGREGPAVLRLRMLELSHALDLGVIDAEARSDAEETLSCLRKAVLERPALTFADVAARLRTRRGR